VHKNSSYPDEEDLPASDEGSHSHEIRGAEDIGDIEGITTLGEVARGRSPIATDHSGTQGRRANLAMKDPLCGEVVRRRSPIAMTVLTHESGINDEEDL
jgi:hypothetical protein